MLLSASSVFCQMIAKTEHIQLHSKYFNHEREIIISTPSAYNENFNSACDVIYVFDSQERSYCDLISSLRTFLYPESYDVYHPFIIVGICSPTYKEKQYTRSNDYLPELITPSGKASFTYGDVKYYGGSSNLKKFIKEELMPYIDSHYRTSGRTLAIGHSLSASFTLDCMLTDELFESYIAISPNLGYDELRLCNDLLNYSFADYSKPRYVFVSMANEPYTWGNQPWTEGWNKTKAFLTSTTFPQNYVVAVKEYPQRTHMSTFLDAAIDALKGYYTFLASHNPQTKETYPIRIELIGDNLPENVYITGNQPAIGSWNPSQVKMTNINDTTKVFEGNLHLPVEFKFTEGSWEHQCMTKNVYPGNLIITKPTPETHTYTAYGFTGH